MEGCGARDVSFHQCCKKNRQRDGKGIALVGDLLLVGSLIGRLLARCCIGRTEGGTANTVIGQAGAQLGLICVVAVAVAMLWLCRAVSLLGAPDFVLPLIGDINVLTPLCFGIFRLRDLISKDRLHCDDFNFTLCSDGGCHTAEGESTEGGDGQKLFHEYSFEGLMSVFGRNGLIGRNAETLGGCRFSACRPYRRICDGSASPADQAFGMQARSWVRGLD